MSYKIVVDSCCDLTEEMKTWNNLVRVPLTLQVDDFKTMDDDNFDQIDFIKRMRAYDDAAKSACPSIDAWLQAFQGEENEIFVFTITSKLSGTYNSAVQAKSIYEEENGLNKKIHVFDSMATSAKETLEVLKLKELKDAGETFDNVVRDVDNYIKNESFLYFCLDDLENMRKNGRLSNLQATVLHALRVKLICKEVDGDIVKTTQDISINRAIIKLADIVAKELQKVDTSEYKLVISHCCCEERAKEILSRLTSKYSFKEAVVLPMGGLNSLYANEGGIILSYGK